MDQITPASSAASTSSPPPVKPKKKAKGPIRWEAILPVTIVFLLIWAYFFFFFDMHLRHALQKVGTNANGAEVDIASIRTSFWHASLDINRIEVTNALLPTHNKIQIGKMVWKMRWDALLRGKIDIVNASVLEIALGVPRARPGFVVPPEPPPPANSKFASMKHEALENVQKEFSKNVLGDVAGLLNGGDPAAQLKSVEGQLKSTGKVKELEAALQVKQKEWKERIDKLPKSKELEAMQIRIKKVKVDGFKSPMEVQESVKEIEAIYKDIDSKYKEVKSTSDALNSDVNTYKNSITELEAQVKQDVKDLESRLKIPKLDVETLSRALFGNEVFGKVKQAEFYMDKARSMMPPKKTAEEKAEYKAPTAHEREKGKTYKFGRANAYPLFWLEKAEISSKAIAGADLSGNLDGKIVDLTDNPPVLGRPTVLSFQGDFPAQKISGVSGVLTVDHTTENPLEKLNLKVASFPVSGKQLVSSPEVKLGFDSAVAKTAFNVELRGKSLNLATNSEFKEIRYLVEAKQPILADILKGATNDVPRVTLDASVTGEWTSPKFKIDTNLARELEKAFEKQIQAKINEAKAKLQKLIDDQIGKQKEKLQAEFNKVQSQITGQLKDKQAEIDKFKTQLDKAKSDAVGSQKKGLETQGKKTLEDLKKKFKF
jgi:uncharacterized protein (TIGR03545 family)